MYTNGSGNFIFLIFTVIMSSAQAQHTNHLINESSPYLQMHVSNPVDWYPWNKKAMQKAKDEDKLLIISIGYAACHWCHVMENESFSDVDVAELMNDKFVSIKVDREERPDVDQVYMDAVQMLNGKGGWPLNAIALPDGRPIYAGTYFTKQQWVQLLQRVHMLYRTEKANVIDQANEITEGIKKVSIIEADKTDCAYDSMLIIQAFTNWTRTFDFDEGGTVGAPKFPMPVGWSFLLDYYYYTQDESALKIVETTLMEMAKGGIYDQIGGGFSRYSVDAIWHVPHFEKMLYDNAQLISLYSKAYQLTHNDFYKNIIVETIDFVDRELSSSTGLFYASIDADSEGEEGEYYVWKSEDVKELLREKYELFAEYFCITTEGNWEHGKNILKRVKDDTKLLSKYNLTNEELRVIINEGREILFENRQKRIRPGLDDKILTSWNALMVKALVDAYVALNDSEYLARALRVGETLYAELWSDKNCLYRNFKNNKATISAFHDDYALLIEAFIALYQSTFDEKWLSWAKELTDYTILHFKNEKSGMFYYTSNMNDELIARKTEVYDNVIPASNSVMAHNLYKLGSYYDNYEYKMILQGMIQNVDNDLLNAGTYMANWMALYLRLSEKPFEIALVGEQATIFKTKFNSTFLPDVLWCGSLQSSNFIPLLQGKGEKNATKIYVCQNKQCSLPISSVETALKQMREK